MKKFTRNFLLGELGLWRFLRKVGLGVVMVLWTTLAFAQEAQDTYHLKVASWDGCYRTDNIYAVPVTMKDFIKISKFDLALEYTNTTDFDFVGVTQVNPAISTMTVQQLTDGMLTIKWANATDVSILPDNSENVMFVLNFKLAAFQHQYLIANKFDFASVFTWKQVDVYNVAGQCEILTSAITNGGLNVSEKWKSVELEYGLGKCVGDLVTVEVTNPPHVAGMVYSFNGTDYNATNKSEVYAPSVNNLLVIKDESCISYVKKFDVKNITPLSWGAESPVYAACPGGKGDIEIVVTPNTGTQPYSFYLVPEEQFIAGDNVYNVYKTGSADMTLLNKYKYSQYVFQVPAGTMANPKYYWVAAQDANGCATITGTYMLNGWKKIAVIDNKEPWEVTTSPLTDLMTTCNDQGDGRIVFSISGGTPFDNGYNVSLNGMYIGRRMVFDSNVDVLCGTVPCNKAVLDAGDYNFVITDASGCSYTVKYTVSEPKAIVFNVDHTDAGCDQAVGELWISSVDGTTGSGPVSSWRWHYSTDPEWINNVSAWYPITTKVTNLPAGVYYVEVEDGNGCSQVWKNPATGNDNAVKILTTVFDLTYNPIKCFGGTTSAKIVLVSGDANHLFHFMAEKWTWVPAAGQVPAHWAWVPVGTGWQTGDTFNNLTSGNYRFSVMDKTANDCVVQWQQMIFDPFKLEATVLTASTRPPSCPGNIDGNVSIKAWGGRPWGGVFGTTYKFWIDDRPAKMASTISDFAINAGEHTIIVEDSAGCKTTVKVNIPDGENFINFQDKIFVACSKDSVNLFNAQAWELEDGQWWKQVGLDGGYLLDYEWYPTINHTSDDDQGWFFEYWTSGTDWVKVPVQGNIYSRNPKLYISSKPWVTKTDIVTMGEVVGHTSKFGAGTYFLVAKDEWGCFSNVDTVTIIEPKALDILVTTENASCANTWTGEIVVKGMNGKYLIPYSNYALYQYVLVQQPDIFSYPDWYATQVTWIDFSNKNDWKNDSIATIGVQKGTYWLAVRDYCAIHDPSQIKVVGPYVIDGLEPIDGTIDVTNVSCFDGTNGAISVVGDGGAGGYKYELALANVAKPNPKTGWPLKNDTGLFGNLAAGSYTVTVKDKLGCTPFTQTVTVKQPDLLTLELQKVDASCFGAQDGIIRYIITGGTKPYKESTNNGQNWYDLPVTTSAVTVFDRRAGAGTYIVLLEDAHGCTTADTITVGQPAKLAFSTSVTAVSCPTAQALNCKGSNIVNDGTIKVTFSGGWNATDAFSYYVTATKGTVTKTLTADKTGAVTFTQLDEGMWTIKLWEHAAAWYAKPYIMNPDYATVYAGGFPDTKQNPDVSVCFATADVKVGGPMPLIYDVEYHDVKCNNTATGEIHVHNVAGGTAPYWFMLEGPLGYSGNGVWVPAGTGMMEYMFKTLPYGHYNVFIKDSKGCMICLESGEINNPPKLTLLVTLVENALCNNDPSGKVKLVATGGVPPFKYALALASEVEKYLFPLEDEGFLGNLTWQESPDFMVKAGVYVGYVMDANGCVQGHSTDANGNVIMNHRVVVSEPTPVVGTVTSGNTMAAGMVDCFGEATGKIKVVTLGGGNGPVYQALVTGFDYTGAPVSAKFDNVTTTGVTSWLGGLKASTNKKTNIPDAEKYTVVFNDGEGCVSAPVLVAVMQPEVFEIDLYVTQDAFICPDDLAGVFEIRVLSGGTTPIVYRYEAWDGTTKKVDSPWGAVNTFQGPAGLLYKVWAKDANGCVAYVEKFITKPAAIKFVSIEDQTCFGAASATAKITVTGQPGRTYSLYKQKYPDANWTLVNGTFDSEIVVTGLTYGDGSEKEGHYYFKAVDNLGCVGFSARTTFVPVQQKLNLGICCIKEGECTGKATFTVGGGTVPYVVTVAGMVAPITSDGSYELTYPAGTHEVVMTDAHGCVATATLIINAQPVVREAEFHGFKWEKADVVDLEAGVDTTLEAGTYEFKYDYNGCERTLNATVIDDLVRTATIADIQGSAADSPLVDAYRQITGTVTGVVPGVGYFVQDAVAAWSGIWVADATTLPVEANGIKVDGVIAEVNGVTTLAAAKAVIMNAPLAITPIVVASPNAAKDEKYESVLVKVEGARFQGTPAVDGSWVIKTLADNTITVNDWMFPYVPVDGHFYTVTGVINGALDLYKLEPRKAADVVDLSSAVVPVIDPANLQFKVYPNPFSDILNIDNSDRLTRVTVTNIAGQRVIDVQYPERVIRTSNLVSGVYIITLFNEEGIVKSDRIVKR